MSASRWRISPSVGGFFRFLPSVTAEEALDMTEFSAEAGDFDFSAIAAGQLHHHNCSSECPHCTSTALYVRVLGLKPSPRRE